MRPIERADILAFYGHGLPMTCKGYAIDLDGELACICGITITASIMVAFSEIKPNIGVGKMTVWRNALKAWELIKGLGYREFFAVASPSILGSQDFLTRLGFEHVATSHQGEVFKWEIR